MFFKDGTAQKISNAILSAAAGVASFIFSLAAFLTITEFNEKIVASIVAGAFCLCISYIASERPNSESAQALNALGDRLMTTEDGDYKTPVPAIVRDKMPRLANAVEHLFSEVTASLESAKALGLYDPVTSLPNRINFRNEAETVLMRRQDDEMTGILFVDLDRFKAVNDGLGHARGDQLLVMVANRLRVVVTSECGSDPETRPIVARLAGDEFTVLFPKANQKDVERAARRIAMSIGEPFDLHGNTVDIGASVGVALAPIHGDNVEMLMRSADIAMYRAKSMGGGQYCVFNDKLASDHQNAVEIETTLREGMDRDQLRLMLQPQLSLQTGEVTGVEALLRWKHPSGELLLPDRFIPIAEKTGLIGDLGEWVISEVASMAAGWRRDGQCKRIAFNVSPRQMERADFFSKLRNIFANEKVPLTAIELEISETAAMNCAPSVLAEIAALRSEGATIAIDDFGAGYSNIARLRQMPIDRVKLDPALLRGMEDDDSAREIVQAVIAMVKAVDAELVAEAVENSAQADLLRAMGCDTVQGYIFAEPMSEHDYLRWVGNIENRTRGYA